MKSKVLTVIISCVLILPLMLLTACTPKNPYKKYESTFANLFDTYAIILGYAESEQQFDSYSQVIYERIKSLHQQYDIYNDYDNINNLKTVNDNAGIAPIEVSGEILDLIEFGKTAYQETDGYINIAMGAVLRIWHDYRTEGIDDPENAKLPPMALLQEAVALTDIDDVIVDREKGTLYLAKKGMSLDVGAVAKGYATQIATDEAKAAGMNSALVSIGGNICAVGKPLDNVRERWGVGIQDPALSLGSTSNIVDTIFTNDAAVVTSGNYQRYYIVDDVVYNHIIDKDTLMPTDKHTAVSVVCADAGIADMLSTAAFLLSIEDGKELLGRYNAEAIWINTDGTLTATDGYIAISKELGGYSSVDK